MTTLVIGAIIVLIVAVLNYWFFGTEIGAAVRATGNNPHMICANGINTDAMVVLGLLLSNGLVAMSGALVAQSNGFADVGMGVGTIVIGLASVIIGEVLFGTRSFKNCLISVILGSICRTAPSSPRSCRWACRRMTSSSSRPSSSPSRSLCHSYRHASTHCGRR